jgi:hypothetical protein
MPRTWNQTTILAVLLVHIATVMVPLRGHLPPLDVVVTEPIVPPEALSGPSRGSPNVILVTPGTDEDAETWRYFSAAFTLYPARVWWIADTDAPWKWAFPCRGNVADDCRLVQDLNIDYVVIEHQVAPARAASMRALGSVVLSAEKADVVSVRP